MDFQFQNGKRTLPNPRTAERAPEGGRTRPRHGRRRRGRATKRRFSETSPQQTWAAEWRGSRSDPGQKNTMMHGSTYTLRK